MTSGRFVFARGVYDFVKVYMFSENPRYWAIELV